MQTTKVICFYPHRGSMDAAVITEESMSADEQKLYDRQIRLWGLDAQKRYAATLRLSLGILLLDSWEAQDQITVLVVACNPCCYCEK